jgi:glycerol-3-phosphate acyltransferase PlsY
VGTLAGMLIALFPIALPICLLVFIITLIATGMVSLGSMLASSALPVVLFIIEGINPDSQISLTLRIFSLIIPLFIIFTHRSNIKRIMDGTENRFEKARIFKKKSGE